MQFYKTYMYEEQIEKKQYSISMNLYNYTSKVEKRLIVNDFFITILIDVTEKWHF